MKKLFFMGLMLLLACGHSFASPRFFVSGTYTEVGLGSIDPDSGDSARIDSDTNYTFYDIARFDDEYLVAAKLNSINLYDESGTLVNSFTDAENPRCVTTYNGEVYYVTNNGNVKKLNVNTGVITSLGYNVGSSSGYNAIYDIAVRSETEIFVRKNNYTIVQAGVGNIHNSNIYYDIYDLVEGPDGYLFFCNQTGIGVIDPDNNISIGYEMDLYNPPYPWMSNMGISYDAESNMLYGVGMISADAYSGYYVLQYDFDQATKTLTMTPIGNDIDDEFMSRVSEFTVNYDSAIPEPISIVLLGLGLSGLFLKRKQK